MEEGIPTAPVLGDAGYGNDTQFRDGVTALGLLYVLGRELFDHGLEDGGRTAAEKVLER